MLLCALTSPVVAVVCAKTVSRRLHVSQVDKLFLKVLQKMGEDNSRFPCTASLINDRMKNE